VAAASSETAQALIAGLGATPDEDLLDAARHPWLRGRQLWLQVIVRGFWHPAGISVTTTSPAVSPAAPSPCTSRQQATPPT
jgi:hypothetical protein